MAPNTIFLEDNDPDFDEFQNIIYREEQGIFFNYRLFLRTLGVCL